ncbi:MAG: peroxiredoxin family protein, partial [Planctomycetota bacterium]
VQGGEIDIAGLGGRPVLLYFWHPRDGKSPATLNHVQGLAARFEADGLVTIGLCVCDEPAEVQPLIEAHGLTFRIALDCDADVHIHKYRIDQTGTPYCYLVAADHRIVWQGPPTALTARRIRALLP